MSIRENYLEICQSIADAAKQAGRRAEDITLVAVSKFVDEERIRLAHEAGAKIIAERFRRKPRAGAGRKNAHV